MRRSRITLSIAALLGAVFFVSTAAEARRHSAPQRISYGPAVDVAAIPAYPFEAERTPRASRRTGNGASGVARTVRLSPDDRKPARNPSLADPMGDAGRTPDRAPEAGTVAGVVRSHKTGATARVSPSFAPVAQAVVDALEARGAVIRFMGGYRRGPCANYSLHPCGYAIDLCQTRRGVVDPRCNMPSRAAENEIARAHGAYSGGEWCNQDRGHIQKLATASKCGSNLYAAVGKFKAKKVASRHHRRQHYASLRRW